MPDRACSTHTPLRLAAYQFSVTGDTRANPRLMCAAAIQAAVRGVRLLAFPECALTGYPPRDIPAPADIDFALLRQACTVNATAPCQAAPTGLFDTSGTPLAECTAGQSILLVHDLDKTMPNFGELGRITLSNPLMK